MTNTKNHPSKLPFRKGAFVLLGIVVVFAATGCTSLTRNPVPLDAMERAVIPGMSGIRAWGDEPSQEFQDDLVQSVRDEWESASEPNDRRMDALLLSGGGSNGGFGAGILSGWTDTGTRPEFKLVTGISTGALAAPYAFLGPDYDDLLEEIFTTVTNKDIYKIRSPFTVLKKDSLTRTDPLAAKIEQVVDDVLLEKIAIEHQKGRRLYVGTTNLDAQRFMIWNMGAIAASDQPGSLELFRQVLLASASIPVAFPPVYFEVEVDGILYDEMHVDGGVIAEFFIWGAMVDLAAAADELGIDPENRVRASIFIIRNGQIDAAPEQVKRRLLDIASRSMLTLIKAVAMGDLARIWALAQRDGVDFNYIGIPSDEEEASAEAFRPEEMRRLFDLGREIALGPEPWLKEPPAFIQ